MNITLYDTSFTKTSIIDMWVRLLSVARYNDVGEFELTIPQNRASTITAFTYLHVPGFPFYRLEAVKNTRDKELGDVTIYSGRSISSMLERRIIWAPTYYGGTLHDALSDMVDSNFTNPVDSNRAIPGFEFVDSVDPDVMAASIDSFFLGDNILDVFKRRCRISDLGFDASYDNGIKIHVYAGKDRSRDQAINPYVIFSPTHDNISSSSSRIDTRYARNVTLVLSDDPTYDRVQINGADDEPSGLSRREIVTDAFDLTRFTGSGEDPLTDDEFVGTLISRGSETLSKWSVDSYYDASLDPNGSFTYGEDYHLGDIVQVEDGAGTSQRARITEIVFSDYSGGRSLNPTFEIIE